MLTEQDFIRIEKQAIGIYQNLELEIIEEIATRIANFGYANTVVLNNIKIAQEMGFLYQDIVRLVAEYNNTSYEKVAEIFNQAGAQTLKFDDRIYTEAGLNPLPINQSSSMVQVLNAAIEKTAGNLQNLVMTTAANSQTSFYNAINSAYMEVSTGVKSYSQAIIDSIKEVSQQGAYIEYPSGQHRSIESAVRTNIVTSVNQTCGKLQLMRAEQMDWDLMEIDAHAGARPEHAVWQGKIVSRSGKRGYLSFKDIGYGEVTGFKGVNCGHDWNPYYPGSTRRYTDKELEEMKNATVTYNGKEIPLYDAKQLQRRMERTIRADKKEIAGLQGILTSNSKDEILIAETKERLLNQQAKYKEHNAILNDFIKQTNSKKDYTRLNIGKTLNNVDKDDIIKRKIKYISGRKNAKIELSYEIPKDIEKYEFDYNHINSERKHKITKQEAIEYIKNSKMRMTVWQGIYENYYSDNGVVFVDTKNKKIRTAFGKQEFDEKTKQYLEVINREE